MISIDLTEAQVAAGEMASALEVLEETTPVVDNILHRNALSAWLLFQKTLEERRDLGAASLVPLFDNVRRYYRRRARLPNREGRAGAADRGGRAAEPQAPIEAGLLQVLAHRLGGPAGSRDGKSVLGG